jgi:hypothetical protein
MKQAAIRATLRVGIFLGFHFNHEDEGDSSSETSVDFQHTTLRYIREGRTLQYRCCDNFKTLVQHLFANYKVKFRYRLHGLCSSLQLHVEL